MLIALPIIRWLNKIILQCGPAHFIKPRLRQRIFIWNNKTHEPPILKSLGVFGLWISSEALVSFSPKIYKKMKSRDALNYLLIIIYSIAAVSADSIHGCGGFVEVNLLSLYYYCLFSGCGENARKERKGKKRRRNLKSWINKANSQIPSYDGVFFHWTKKCGSNVLDLVLVF